MFPVRELFDLLVRELPFYVRDRWFIVAIILFLVYVQYQRVAGLERQVFGRPRASAGAHTLIALVYGTVGGVLATAIFLFLGISLSDIGILHLWILAILLAFLHPRFLCFAYAAGILSASHLLAGWPQHLNVPALMALVAALHLVEAALIWIHGPQWATPLYVRAADGRVVGGFTLQKFWPLPFIALVAAQVGGEWLDQASLLRMPEWWPLLGPAMALPEGKTLVHALFPVIAGLGYGDIAITRHPRRKARQSAGMLLAYSVVLMVLALLAHRMPAWALAAALFSPLGHELVIYLGRRAETLGRPVFVEQQAPMVLDVFPGTPAHAMGLQTGDVILALNGQPVRSKRDLALALEPWAAGVEVEVENAWGRSGVRRLRYAGKVPPLGVLLTPGPHEPAMLDLADRSRYGRLVGFLRRRIFGWAVRR